MIQGGREQSVWRRDKPDFMVQSYLQMTAVASLTWDGYIPKRKGKALIIGLGGGVICKFLLKQFPNLSIEVVEPNHKVVELARQHFDLDHRVVVHTTGGRAFISERKDTFDIIFLDAFDKVYIPAELMTQEFLTMLKSRLNPKGVFIANTWVLKNLTAHENATYRSVFSPVWDIRKIHNTDGNRIILFNPTLPNGLEAVQSLITDRCDYADARNALLPEHSAGNFRFAAFAQKLRIQEIETGRTGTVLSDANIAALRTDRAFED
jgi:spermidine synthase